MIITKTITPMKRNQPRLGWVSGAGLRAGVVLLSLVACENSQEDLDALLENPQALEAERPDTQGPATETPPNDRIPARPLLSYATSNSFGAVRVYSSQSITVTVTNVGTEDAVLGALATEGDSFEWNDILCAEKLILEIGQSCTFSITINPEVTGVYTAKTTITYQGSLSTYELSITQSASVSKQAPSVSSSPSSVDFADVDLSATATKSLIVSNSTSVGAKVDEITLTGDRYSIADDSCTGQDLISPQTCTITLRFSPTTTGAALGDLKIKFSYPGGIAEVDVALSGVGQKPQPSLQSSPTSWDFGAVVTGATSNKSLIISNTSTTVGVVGTPTISGSGYAIASDSCQGQSLAAGGVTCTVEVTFSAAVPGSMLGILSVPFTYAGGGVGTLTVNLSGIGNVPQPTLTISPSSHHFNNVSTNANSSTTFVVANNTSVSAVVQTASVSGSGLTITANSCDNNTISAGGNCSITVKFAPASVGTIAGTLTIPYLSVQGISYSANVTLAGTGVAPSVNFAFNGFDGNIVHVSNLTGTGVTLTWEAATGGSPSYYKISRATGAVSTVTGALTPVSTLTYNVTGLVPNTTYEFRINAYDSFDVSDGNLNTISVTTPNVIGSTFNGWSDVIATGSVLSSIGEIDDAKGATGANRLDSNLAVSLTGNAGPAATVKIAWETFTFDPSGSAATGYNIYRTTTSGSGYALVGTSASETYVDTTVSNNTKYYYVVHPTIAGTEVTAATTADSEIAIYVPPQNMALVHRWIANREGCVNLIGKAWPGDIDRSDNYSCDYDWGLGFGPNSGAQKTKWDIGYSFFVDRWENGCKMSATGPVYGTAAVAGGTDGDVYFRQGTNNNANQNNVASCHYKKSGTWYEFASNLIASADRAAMVTNEPGFPPVSSTQANAYYTCKARTVTGVGALRLLRIQELIAARAWKGMFHNPTSTQIIALESGTDHASNGSCNSNLGNNINPADPTFLRQTGRKFVAGSYATENCISRYEIQDLITNLNEWTSEQTNLCNSAATCTGIISTLDPDADYLDGFAFDGAMGVSMNTYTTFTNGIPMLAMPTSSVSATLGSKAINTLTAYDQFFAYNVPGGVIGGITADYFMPDSGNINGRFTWSNLNASLNYSTWGGDIGFRCVGTAP